MKPKRYAKKDSPLAAIGVTQAVYQLFAGPFVQSSSREKFSNQETRSPYPGICICSASELLDFGFENAEILHERED
jgi:hypothetical protein